jgi:hypothetical protein
MTPTAWRSVLLTLCAACAIIQVIGLCDILGVGGAPPWFGVWGVDFGASAEPYHLSALAVDPNGPAYRAGVRQGDLIDVRSTNLVDRIAEFYQPLDGRPIVASIRRGARTMNISVVPGPYLRGDTLLSALSSLWILLFAVLILLRRAFVPGNLLLAAVLILFVGIPEIVTPWVWPYIVLYFGGEAFLVGVALWATYAGCFGRPLSPLRKAAQLLCYGLAGSACAISLAALFAMVTLQIDPTGLWFSPSWGLVYTAAVFAAVLCGALAIAAARGADRQRAVWLLVPLAVMWLIFLANNWYVLLSSSYASTVVTGWVTTLAYLVVPVVLTYAAVSRRLIDVGFVLNRTVVFAVVSTIVIGAFVLAEWAASAWLAGAMHTTSADIGIVVALVLGLSLRYIHRYVERFVDRVFFWKRHADEAALRRFAHESSYITDRSALLDRTLREVKAHTGAERAMILIRDGAASYVSASSGERVEIGENDPGMVALRAWHKAVDLRALPDTQLRGEYAFPMVSRGELVGVLVCGSKPDGELYAPDESDALLALAHGVGAALGVLGSDRDGADDIVAKELAALRTVVETALHELRPTAT